MFVRLSHNTIVNTSTVKTIEEISRSPEGYPRCRVTFVDGTRESIVRNFDKLDWLTGQVIPAPAGFQAVQAYWHEDGPSFGLYPVAAFRLTEEGPFPICHWASLNGWDWALLWPDGRCERIGDQLFDSLDAYKASVIELNEMQAKKMEGRDDG